MRMSRADRIKIGAAIKLLMIISCLSAGGQSHVVRVFAHNDYLHNQPFHAAYEAGVDYVEADVFHKRGKLFVAHTAVKITEDRTLTDLYLMPLLDKVAANKGYVYSTHERTLTLMVDLKTEGTQTLLALVDELKRFPSLIACPTLIVAVSGNVPPPGEWHKYPEFIHFDGRPAIKYSADQLARVALISASFKDYSSWNGRGEMSNEDRIRLESAVKAVHAVGRPVRFWAAPDFAVAWKLLINLGVDVLNTDDVEGAMLFMRQ